MSGAQDSPVMFVVGVDRSVAVGAGVSRIDTCTAGECGGVMYIRVRA